MCNPLAPMLARVVPMILSLHIAIFLAATPNAAAIEVKTSKQSFAVGESIEVVVSNAPSDRKDQIITIVPKGAAPGGRGIETIGLDRATQGRIQFRGLTAGEYEIRLYAHRNQRGLVASQEISVGRTPPTAEIEQPVKGARTGPIEGCEKQLDVTFVVDGSSSVRPQDWQHTIDFVRSAAAWLVPGSKTSARTGLVQFSARARFENLADPEIKKMGGSTNLAAALLLAKERIADNRHGGRSIMIIWTDGDIGGRPDPQLIADELKKDGVEIFAIGIGDALDPGSRRYRAKLREGLIRLTGSERKVLRAKDHAALSAASQELSKQVCDSIGLG